ncbi:MAG: hypothetical protein N2712_05730 [Brevinematales bacterium]|nr:hypothetical protein [Brevinematales bacterium]
MEVLKNFLNSNGIEAEISTQKLQKLEKYQVAVIDCREVELDLINNLLSKNIRIISLDDTQTFKPSLISVMSLPYLALEGPNPNFEGLEYLILDPKLLELQISQEIDILITFGGEDPKGLTTITLKNFLPLLKNKNVCIYVGKLFKNQKELLEICTQNEVEIFESQNTNLHHLIAKSKYVITSFGITLYESISLGKRVLLINNSKYHHELYTISKLNKKGVYEIGYIDDEGKLCITQDIQQLISNEISTEKFEIDITSNLFRWKDIIERITELNIDFEMSKLINSKSIHRSTTETIFLIDKEKIKISIPKAHSS